MQTRGRLLGKSRPAAVLICILAIGIAIIAGTANASSWPQFPGPTADNVSPETELTSALPAPVVFDREIGSGYSAPSIRDGIMVLHHRLGGSEIVEACDANTGVARWKKTYPSSFTDPFGYNNGPRCSPLLTADRCYTFGAEGVLLCLDLKSGAEIWRRETAQDFDIPDAFFGVGSSPILEGDLLIVMVGGQPNSGMAAFDAATGKTVWQNVGEKTWNGIPLAGWPGQRTVAWNPGNPLYQKQASYCSPVAATIHGRRVLCCMRQGLVSVDPQTGEVNFSFWFRSRLDASVTAMTPIVQGDLVFISNAYDHTGSVLLRVQPDCKSVEEVWRGTQLEMHWSRPASIDGFLYGFSGRNEPDARFRCVELETGALKWDRAEGWPNGGHAKLRPDELPPNVFGRGSGVYADGKLYVLGEAGLLGIFKPSREHVIELARWQVPGLTYPCWAGPVLSEKKLYLRSEERLVCLDLSQPEKRGDLR